MIAGLAKGDKSLEAGKIGDQFEKHFCIGPTLLNREVYYSTLIYHTFKELYSQLGSISCANKTGSEKEIIDFYVLPQFERFKEIIDEDIKKDPSFANSAIVKFCYSIIKDNKLFKELEEVSVPAENSSVKAKISFQLKNLKEKVWFLRKLKEKKNFTCVQRAFGDEWGFYDLINDRDFKQMYIDKAVTESANESFKEDINKCIELAEQGKETASKYFERKNVELQAYYTEIGNAHRVLNVNLIHYDKSEPTRISDILQQEKDIKELNIYCNKKHEIHAHQKDKKRYYEIKEGACYGMISTWPVKDKSGNVSICTMIMNVSSDGITEVLKFNGKDFVSSEEILELIKQNDELYIQSLSLYDAVLEKGKAADVVPVANNDLQSNESIRINKDGGQGDLENGASTPSFTDESTQTEETLPDVVPVANSDTSTQMEVDLQQPETQTEIDLQQIDWLLSENCKLRGENAELMESNEQLEDKIVILEGKLKKETQRNIKLQAELEQKNEGLASALAEEQKMEEGLKSMREEKRKLKEELKIVNAGKKNLEKELNQARESAEQIMVEQRQQKERLKDQLRELDQEYQEYKVQKESDRQDSDLQDTLGEERLKLNIEELENEYEEFPGDKVLTLELTKDEDKVEESRNELERKKEKCKQLLEEENEWGDELVGMLNGLKEKICADGQRSLNDQFYTLTGNISSEPDNAPQKKSGLSKSLSLDNESYVPLREETTLLRSLSIDDGYGSDEEKCDNGLSSNISSIEQRSFNHRFYNLTGDISSEPDNVSLQQRKLLRSSSVPPEEERRLSKSSSFDEGYNSDEENCDNHPCSSVLVLGSVSPIREQARSKSVDR